MKAEDIAENILYEDSEILVVHKAAGIAVQHASFATPDLESKLRVYLAKQGTKAGGGVEEHAASARGGAGDHAVPAGGGMAQGPGGSMAHGPGGISRKPSRGRVPELYVIHRLDTPVEGILVFAKTRTAAAALNRSLQTGGMKKEYLAVTAVEGGGADDSRAAGDGAAADDSRAAGDGAAVDDSRAAGDGAAADDSRAAGDTRRLVDYLQKDSRAQMSRVVPSDTPHAKRAELKLRILEKDGEGHSLLLHIELVTGRFHQIRAQLSAAGMPIAGDVKYGYAFPPAGGVLGRMESPAGGGDGHAGAMDDGSGHIGSRPGGGNGRGVPRAAGLALCAFQLSFTHPKTRKTMRFSITPGHPAFENFRRLDR